MWSCTYHIVWTPKYRYRILEGEIKQEVEECVRGFSDRLGSEIVEMNIQKDHVHIMVLIPPKVSVSQYVGTVKGRTAIRVLNKFKQLKQRPYWGNHFWARGYCVDTIGLDWEMIQKYIRYQEEQEKKSNK